MKKLVYILLASAVAVVLFGCDATPAEEQEESISTEQTGPEVTDDGSATEDPGSSDDGTSPGADGTSPGEEGDENQDDGVTISSMPGLAPLVESEIGAVSFPESAQAYRQAANSFALRLLPCLYQDKSFVASPLSIQMALSMAAEGAAGAPTASYRPSLTMKVRPIP